MGNLISSLFCFNSQNENTLLAMQTRTETENEFSSTLEQIKSRVVILETAMGDMEECFGNLQHKMEQ